MAPLIPAPVCPLCHTPPGIVFGGGHQAFCFVEDCEVVSWDPLQQGGGPPTELVEHVDPVTGHTTIRARDV